MGEAVIRVSSLESDPVFGFWSSGDAARGLTTFSSNIDTAALKAVLDGFQGIDNVSVNSVTYLGISRNKKGQAQQFRGLQNRFRQRSLHQKLSTDVR